MVNSVTKTDLKGVQFGSPQHSKTRQETIIERRLVFSALTSPSSPHSRDPDIMIEKERFLAQPATETETPTAAAAATA
ncbi:hypothetical protein M0804_001877 [Polistes exclamans]|nr:hypothetical protein M0804_001877 [Polistes exclamans]